MGAFFVLATAAAALVSAGSNTPSRDNKCLSAVTWGGSRVDVFGVAHDDTIWHKYYTGKDWQPHDNKFEQIPAKVLPVDAYTGRGGCPSVTSWGEDRFDIFYLNGEDRHHGYVMHKFWEGRNQSWQPSFEGAKNLGGGRYRIKSLASTSWGEHRLDVIGKAQSSDGSHFTYVHKFWNGEGWSPEGTKWEKLGGSFFSDPAVVSRGPGRLHVVGLGDTTGTLWHKYWSWHAEEWSEWENLGGGPFVGNPVATSWGLDRLDFWAINSDGELEHIYWDNKQKRYSEWENLGGTFTDTPKVVHGKEGRIDILGKNLDDESYQLKSWDGHKWQPSTDGWWEMAGPFWSEPELLARKGEDFLNVFGIDYADELRTQIWSGSEWEPRSNKTWSLGDLSNPYAKKGSDHDVDKNDDGAEIILSGSEL